MGTHNFRVSDEWKNEICICQSEFECFKSINQQPACLNKQAQAQALRSKLAKFLHQLLDVILSNST